MEASNPLRGPGQAGILQKQCARPIKKFFIKKNKKQVFPGGKGKGSPQIKKEKKKTLSVLLEFLDLKNAERSVAKKLN